MHKLKLRGDGGESFLLCLLWRNVATCLFVTWGIKLNTSFGPLTCFCVSVFFRLGWRNIYRSCSQMQSDKPPPVGEIQALSNVVLLLRVQTDSGLGGEFSLAGCSHRHLSRLELLLRSVCLGWLLEELDLSGFLVINQSLAGTQHWRRAGKRKRKRAPQWHSFPCKSCVAVNDV